MANDLASLRPELVHHITAAAEVFLRWEPPLELLELLSPRTIVKEWKLLEFKLPRRSGSTTIACNLVKKHRGFLVTLNDHQTQELINTWGYPHVASWHKIRHIQRDNLDNFIKKKLVECKLIVFDCYNGYCDNKDIQELMETLAKTHKFVAFR